MSNGNPKYTDTSDFALWDKYETVAMHFNDLIMRLRTQALGALTGVVAISGFAVSFAQKAESQIQWVILFGALLFFTFAWVALWVLDLGYYNKLLRGAVHALLKHEAATQQPAAGPGTTPILLSTSISQEVGQWHRTIQIFYSLVLVGLLIGVAYTGWQAIWWTAPTHDIPEYKIQLSLPANVKAAFGSLTPNTSPKK